MQLSSLVYSLLCVNCDVVCGWAQVGTAKSITIKRKAMLDGFQENVAGSQVCDKCLQPIDAAHSSQSLLRLQADYDLAQKEHQLLSKVKFHVMHLKI